MAIIYTYPIKTAAAADLVLISDSADENKTKNTSISSIKDVIDVVDVISAGPGISVSSPTGNVTVGNTGVLSLIAGSNISLSGSTGNVTISTSASNVDGSGTTNRIPRWTDSNTLGDSQISQNASSIGIGTALNTSTGSLEVYSGSANNQIFVTTPDTGQAGINFGGTSNKTGGQISYSDNSNLMMFHTNNSEKMRILSNGNLGIGTTTPAQKLDVEGDVTFGTGNKFVTGVNVLEGVGPNGVSLRSGISSAVFPSFSNSDDTNTGMFLPGSDVLGLSTAGLERLRITSAGNVGINNINPTFTLDVTGNIKASTVIKGTTLQTSSLTLIADDIGNINLFAADNTTPYGLVFPGTVGTQGQVLKLPTPLTPTVGLINNQELVWGDPAAITAGGSNTEIQYNKNGAFAGEEGFTFTQSTFGGYTNNNNILTLGKVGSEGGTLALLADGTNVSLPGRIVFQGSQGGEVLLQGPVDPLAAPYKLSFPNDAPQALDVVTIGKNNPEVLHFQSPSIYKRFMLTANCSKVGSNAQLANNPRQAAFSWGKTQIASTFGPMLPIVSNMKINRIAIKLNTNDVPVIGATGNVNFKLGKLSNPNATPDTQEGTTNYTSLDNSGVDLAALNISSADSGTHIFKTLTLATPIEYSTGDILVLVFTKPAANWTGTGATEGDLQVSIEAEYI